MISALSVLTVLIPIHSLPVGLWLSVVMLFCSAALLWSFGLELLGWLMLIVYVGALAVLFLFVVMLLDLGNPSDYASMSWWHIAWYLLPWQLEGLISHAPSQNSVSHRFYPEHGAWMGLGQLYHGCPEVVVLLGCTLTLGLFGAAVVPWWLNPAWVITSLTSRILLCVLWSWAISLHVSLVG